MELAINFLQGVSSAGGGVYARAIGDDDFGLFLMDMQSGEVSIFHTENLFRSISYVGNGKFRGWATNVGSENSFLYEFSIETGSLTALSVVENPGDINYAQGVYSFDASSNSIYFKGFRYTDIESGTMEWGIYKFDLSAGLISFELNEQVGDWTYFQVLNGTIASFTVGRDYSIPQGVMTYDSVNDLFYTISWVFDGDGAIVGQQILQLKRDGSLIEVLNVIEVKQDEFVYDIVYDADSEVFFAYISDGDGNQVVVVDLSGNVFSVGSANNDSHVGSISDDNYFGMGGDDNIVGNGGDDILIGGEGADTISGGAQKDVITGGSGDDVVNAGSGDDLIIGGNGAGNDTYIGGSGIDTVKYTSALAAITVNLSASSNQAKSTLSGDRAGIGTDQLSQIENIIAGRFSDALTGNAEKNRIEAGKGNDTINGGAGNDTLNGGSGKDRLTGGTGNDSFIFKSASESSTRATTADVITDFVKGKDKINLSAIDAFASSTTNDTFVWNGTTAFSSSTKGEVRYEKFNKPGTANDYTMVWIDNDRDKDVEMAIRLTGLHNLTASDFIL
jgi:Ca2+-binding RTX toxin-like protein